ncbi:MAG: hypothetical protein U5Q03_05195 [Bacteroidota bacterium]|nr:hypothetical protein [Bacteroidota bacterium]
MKTKHIKLAAFLSRQDNTAFHLLGLGIIRAKEKIPLSKKIFHKEKENIKTGTTFEEIDC